MCLCKGQNINNLVKTIFKFLLSTDLWEALKALKNIRLILYQFAMSPMSLTQLYFCDDQFFCKPLTYMMDRYDKGK